MAKITIASKQLALILLSAGMSSVVHAGREYTVTLNVPVGDTAAGTRDYYNLLSTIGFSLNEGKVQKENIMPGSNNPAERGKYYIRNGDRIVKVGTKEVNKKKTISLFPSHYEQEICKLEYERSFLAFKPFKKKILATKDVPMTAENMIKQELHWAYERGLNCTLELTIHGREKDALNSKTALAKSLLAIDYGRKVAKDFEGDSTELGEELQDNRLTAPEINHVLNIFRSKEPVKAKADLFNANTDHDKEQRKYNARRSKTSKSHQSNEKIAERKEQQEQRNSAERCDSPAAAAGAAPLRPAPQALRKIDTNTDPKQACCTQDEEKTHLPTDEEKCKQQHQVLSTVTARKKPTIDENSARFLSRATDNKFEKLLFLAFFRDYDEMELDDTGSYTMTQGYTRHGSHRREEVHVILQPNEKGWELVYQYPDCSTRTLLAIGEERCSSQHAHLLLKKGSRLAAAASKTQILWKSAKNPKRIRSRKEPISEKDFNVTFGKKQLPKGDHLADELSKKLETLGGKTFTASFTQGKYLDSLVRSVWNYQDKQEMFTLQEILSDDDFWNPYLEIVYKVGNRQVKLLKATSYACKGEDFLDYDEENKCSRMKSYRVPDLEDLANVVWEVHEQFDLEEFENMLE